MSKIILEVPDMSCAHCESTVRGALQGQPGVNSVQVDLPGKVVYLDYDESALDLESVSEILDEEGYPVIGTREGGPSDGGKRGFIPLISK
ncbi:MAG: heavy-metal-associated domain-containing protein [Chloroflexota bacterium]|nr:heavy-metal-associated domain-containing protein [Chloroflexota bacterium]MDQ5864532.1 heavy-metal-associated domain-containing protein [Chloroflexota bacterium]